jgi:hypothetical protein
VSIPLSRCGANEGVVSYYCLNLATAIIIPVLLLNVPQVVQPVEVVFTKIVAKNKPFSSRVQSLIDVRIDVAHAG